MANYDGKTEHGIPYIVSLYSANFEYQTTVDDLDGLVTTRKSIMSGNGTVTSSSLGSRSVTRPAMSAKEVLQMWDKLMAKKKELEVGRKPRRALGAVPRDW